MTEQEKQLLLKDLCARLPYIENWVQFEGKDWIVTGYGHGRVSLLPSLVSSAVGPCPLVEEVKPYLRPMSSMTEEEKIEWDAEYAYNINSYPYEQYLAEMIDWLNTHHLDYRGLIEKGLALEAPEEMYKTE